MNGAIDGHGGERECADCEHHESIRDDIDRRLYDAVHNARTDVDPGEYQVQPVAHTGDGERKWIPARDGAWLAEGDADALIAREAEFDSDLWVLAVEDRDGRHLLADHLVRGEDRQS